MGLLNNTSGKTRMNVSNCNLYNCTDRTIWNCSSCSVYVSNTDFDNNRSVCDNRGSAEFTHCKFLNNKGYIIYNAGSGYATFSNVLVANNKFSNSDWACFMNLGNGNIEIYNMTSADNNTRTFRNDGYASGIRVYNSVCSSSNNGSSSISRTNCITFTKSGLDYSYRPTYYSACVDAGSNNYVLWNDTDLAGNTRKMGNSVDIGCYEYLPVSAKTKTSGKTTIYWDDAGTASYTVQYRKEGTEKWTTKIVKNTTQLTIPVKNNTYYEVLVTPKGMEPDERCISYAGSLAKLGMKAVNKTSNSISIQLTNIIPWPTFQLGIKKQNEKEYVYYEIDTIANYPNGYGNFGPYSYTYETISPFVDNTGKCTFTIVGLDSNTKYDFQIAHTYSLSYKNDVVSSISKLRASTSK